MQRVTRLLPTQPAIGFPPYLGDGPTVHVEQRPESLLAAE